MCECLSQEIVAQLGGKKVQRYHQEAFQMCICSYQFVASPGLTVTEETMSAWLLVSFHTSEQRTTHSH